MRKRAGWSVSQAAWQLDVSVRVYREIEAGERVPNWKTFDRMQDVRLAADVRRTMDRSPGTGSSSSLQVASRCSPCSSAVCSSSP